VIPINCVKRFGKAIFKIYEGIGILAMGLLAACVIFAVIARYIFSLSWKELAEFTTTLFAFTTFWGMGICVLQNENIVIDVIYNLIKPTVKRWVAAFNNSILLIIDLLFLYYSIGYIKQAGDQISLGMEIPMKYMYGIMPVGCSICAICIIIKIIENITAPISVFEQKGK
jgi:TRAP-type C4-dicarboxylate transport system permease small subunit